MILTFQTAALFFTALVTALIAGLFYSYSCSVSPGLGRLPDKEYLLAMQSINRAILNPVFFFSFMGTVILLPLCTWLCFKQGIQTSAICLVVASLTYLVGVFGVTIVGNVPLNNALDNLNVQQATLTELAVQRTKFEMPWNRLNNIRTIASILALVFVIAACLLRHKILIRS
jgi:uncharacterized membrane protein